ncbi:NAD(P)H-dependent flavin oxidoreductase [Janthinobacterium sp. HLX7-2]|uniref:NAD(P)H-dependent flavin oxidoreductase n=1 Tax=Janthinobacterium sp. HLX7-2 TaxID=1259331 RepID=UPI003F25672C
MSHLPKTLQGLKLPVICSPLFIVSNPSLVIAQCKAGVIGTMPSLNARPSSKLQEWLHEITEALAAHDKEHPESPAAPFGINLIVHKTNERHEHDLEVITKYKVPFVITSLGARPEVNDAVHSYGGIVMHDVINNAFAHKAIEKGADGLIAVAAGAGGHAGTKSPFALIQEIRQWFDGPLALSGSIATGSSILAAQALGADFAYIGSAFIATEEALAKDTYKDAIVDCNSDDIVYTNMFTGVHGNYLKPSIINAGLDPDNLPVSDASKMNLKQEGLESKWQSVQTASASAPAAAAVVKNTEAKAWRDVWGCGQGIGAISKISSTAEFVEQLSKEYMEAKSRICSL